MRKINLAVQFVFFACIVFIFRSWILNSEIIGGDWPYYYKDFLLDYPKFLSLWTPWQGNGLGGINPVLGLQAFSSLLIVPFVQGFSIPWVVVYKIGWFGLFFGLSVMGIRKFVRELFPSVDEISLWISSLIFIANTYILMVVGGGQMGVAVAYSMTPVVLLTFIRLINISNIRRLLIASCMWGLQLAIDPRFAYVSLVGIGVYCLAFGVYKKFIPFKAIFSIAISCMVSGLLNAFWLVPLIVMRNNPLDTLGNAYTSLESFQFFSFAKFSNSVAMLHPNWPENIFGKTYFLQPEFLLFPLFAFSSLLFIRFYKNQYKLYLVFLCLLALVGAFLSKGANGPFENISLWMFERLPGFIMFRDSTKFYVLTILAYATLIPVFIHAVTRNFSTRRIILTFCFLIFFVFTIRPILGKGIGGTFASRTVPNEYKELEMFLHGQPEFFRTLWVPRQQRFSYASLNHGPIEAEPLFLATNSAELSVALRKPESRELLRQLSIKYIIVPYDSLGELFLRDRVYDEQVRQVWVDVLDATPWLKKVQQGRLTIYESPSHEELFWLETHEPVTYTRRKQDEYVLSFSVTSPTTLYFSQNFHPGWVMESEDGAIQSQKTQFGLNSFPLDSGNHSIRIFFAPQRWVDMGVNISVSIFLITCLLVLGTTKMGRRLLRIT